MSLQPLCIHCVTGSRIPGEPKGELKKLGPYETYVTRTSHSSDGKAIVIFTDVFGLALANSKIIADILAERTGLPVFVPDLFHGDPINPDSIDAPSTGTEIGQLKYLQMLTMGLKIITYAPWMYRHWPTSKFAEAEQFLSALKKEENVQRIGAVGFCFGGKFAVDFNKKGLVDVSVATHPSFCTASSFTDLKGPILGNFAEIDTLVPERMRKAITKHFENNPSAPAHDFPVYKNCIHGFGTRPNLAIEDAKKAFEQATERTAQWFQAHL